MKKNAIAVTASMLVAASPFAAAEMESPHSFSANAALTTDYIFRGFTQTNEQAAIQGGFDYAHTSGFYAGVWGSSLEFNENKSRAAAGEAPVDEATIEIDLYGGFASEFANGTGWDVGVLYYWYPGSEDSLDYDFVEVYGGLSHAFSDVPLEPTAGVTVSFSPDFFGSTGDAVYVDGSLDLSLPAGFGLGFHVGSQSIDEGDDYVDWKVGVSNNLAGFDLELAYYDTDVDDDDLADARVVFTVSRSF